LARRGSARAAGFFLQINLAETVIHKTDQPDAMVDFFDADEGHAEVDLLVVQAKASAAGDQDRAVVKWVMRFWDASMRTGRSRVKLGRARRAGERGILREQEFFLTLLMQPCGKTETPSRSLRRVGFHQA